MFSYWESLSNCLEKFHIMEFFEAVWHWFPIRSQFHNFLSNADITWWLYSSSPHSSTCPNFLSMIPFKLLKLSKMCTLVHPRPMWQAVFGTPQSNHWSNILTGNSTILYSNFHGSGKITTIVGYVFRNVFTVWKKPKIEIILIPDLQYGIEFYFCHFDSIHCLDLLQCSDL